LRGALNFSHAARTTHHNITIRAADTAHTVLAHRKPTQSFSPTNDGSSRG